MLAPVSMHFCMLLLLLHLADATISICTPSTRVSFRLPSTVVLDRVRHCRIRILCFSRLTKQSYSPLSRRILRHISKKITLTELSSPTKDRTENVVLFFAGQQSLKGRRSGITGQREWYKANWNARTPSHPATLNPRSLAAEVAQMGVFPLPKSFLALVFDTQFDYQHFSWTKTRTARAYFDYIVSKFGPRTRTVYLAGHSRGGCLAMRVAAKLTSKFRNLRVVVSVFDPVCAVPQLFNVPEFGLSEALIPNPVNPKYHVQSSNMTRQFPSNACVSIRSFLSGEPLLFVHSFGHAAFRSRTGTLQTKSGRPWYTQSFHNETHSLHLTYSLRRQAAAYAERAVAGFPCKCFGI